MADNILEISISLSENVSLENRFTMYLKDSIGANYNIIGTFTPQRNGRYQIELGITKEQTLKNINNAFKLDYGEDFNITLSVLSRPVKGYVRYTVSIYLKDGRYKYEITDFTHDPTGPNAKSVGLITTDTDYPGDEKRKANQKWMDNTWKDVKEQIHNNISPIELSIKEGMNKVSENKNEDW